MKFKIGDKVKHKDFGVGEIVHIDKKATVMPYAVQFETFNEDLHDLEMCGAPKVKNGHGRWCEESELELDKQQPQNLIPQIAKMLGVEIGEEFEINEISNIVCKFTDEYLLRRDKGEAQWLVTFVELNYLLSGEWHIKKLFNKPHLTEDEKTILRNIPKEYKWIARDGSGELYVYENKPKNGTSNDYFTFFELINGKEKIIKLPKTPILTEDEKAILRNLSKKYEWITRDKSGLYVYDDDGTVFESFNMFGHLFQFINLEDEEPYNIEELLMKGELK